MSTLQGNHVCDSSTLANFKDWAQSISTAFSTFGWTKSSDTGQVDWAVIASVPSSSSWVYEIWHPNDALQTGSTAYYLKVEYGNQGTVSGPSLRLTIGTGTNGSGTITGAFIMGPYLCPKSQISSPSTSTTYECDFSGDTGRFGCLLWRASSSQTLAFAVERTLDSSGSANSDGVTLLLLGNDNGGVGSQQTLAFGVGLGPYNAWPLCLNSGGVSPGNGNNPTSQALAGNIAISPIFPAYGKFGNPHTVVALGRTADAGEGTTITSTLYGATLTYLISKAGNCSSWNPGPGSTGNGLFGLRYD